MAKRGIGWAAQAVLGAALLVVAPAGVSAADVDAARLAEVVAARVADGSFSGAVLVARRGDVLLDAGYGLADREWQVPNTPETRFRLGSVTKQFTAAAFLLLEEDGRLSLDDPVSAHLQDAPEAWDGITLLHLLTHTSGIPNFTDLPEYPIWKLQPATAKETVARFRDLPLDFEPGAKMSYSNSGYLLLGLILEEVTGQAYARFLEERIFGPLGMKDTGVDSNAAILPRRARGYTPAEDGVENAAFIDMTVPHAAGALYSTTRDLLRWNRGLYGGALLSVTSLAKMTTPQLSGYALGLRVHEVAGRRVIQHGGGIEGFNTHLAWYPDTQVTVVALANLNGGAPGEIAASLGALAHGEGVTLPQERQAIEVPRERLERFAGRYALAPTANLVIAVAEGGLTAQLAGQPPVALFPESENSFFARDVDAQIEFELDAGGAVTALVLHQGGADRRAPRVAEREAVELPAEALEAYAGTYELQPGFDLVIRVEEGRLLSRATGQAEVELYAEAEAEDRFFLKAANAQIDFERDDAGAVVALVLHQGGQNLRAPRR